MNSEVTIRAGDHNDFAAVLQLVKALADFEKQPDAVTNTLQRMQQEQDCFRLFVAEANGEIIGMAVYFFAYYTWVGKSLYLDDLFVKPEFRRQGIGKRLLQAVLAAAKQEEVKRVRWQVLDWNQEAIAFYRSLGAGISSEWLNCDFAEADIRRF